MVSKSWATLQLLVLHHEHDLLVGAADEVPRSGGAVWHQSLDILTVVTGGSCGAGLHREP